MTTSDPQEVASIYFNLSVMAGLLLCVFLNILYIYQIYLKMKPRCRSIAYIMFLVLCIVLRATVLHQRAFNFFVDFMIAGTIIFVSALVTAQINVNTINMKGGGPVVIPLLRTYTVDPGW